MLLGQSAPMSRLRLAPTGALAFLFMRKRLICQFRCTNGFFVIFGEGSTGSEPPLRIDGTFPFENWPGGIGIAMNRPGENHPHVGSSTIRLDSFSVHVTLKSEGSRCSAELRSCGPGLSPALVPEISR